MKKLTIRQMAAVKNIAKNVNPLVSQKNKALAKIEELNKEIETINAQIDGHEGGVKAMTDGLTSEYLVKKVIETTDKVDKDGKPIKITKYVPSDNVVLNEEEKCYYIKDEFIPSDENTDNSVEENNENEFNL